MKPVAVVLAGLSVATATTYLQETFESDPFSAGWVHSTWKKKSESGKFMWTSGEWNVDPVLEKGLMKLIQPRQRQR